MIFAQYKEILKKLGVTQIELWASPLTRKSTTPLCTSMMRTLGRTWYQVFQAGFLLGDKVIRHAIVQVAN